MSIEEASEASDGSSWDDAFTDPGDAMAVATSGDQIWVRGSRYTRTAGDPPGSYLVIKTGVKIYGGFDGTETDISERNPKVNVTEFVGRGFIHVVVGAEGALLDGLYITSGDAQESGDDGRGGGLFADGVTMAVVNCEFRKNYVGTGAGAYVRNAAVTFDSCTFYDNFAVGTEHSTPGGGGLYLDNSTAMLTGCTFKENNASGAGGAGLLANNSAVTANCCLFYMNVSNLGNGGAYYDCENSQTTVPVYNNCEFEDNIAINGGGMYIRYCSPAIDECEFDGNNATDKGGGIYSNFSSLVVKSSIFTMNTSANGGSGVYNHSPLSGDPRFWNCLMTGNRSDTGGYGAAMFNNTVSPSIINCIFVFNTTKTRTGGINNLDSSPFTDNCILWENRDSAGYPQLYNDGQGEAVVTYTNIAQSGYSHSNNMNADPVFVTGPLGQFYLSQTDAGQGTTSPCVDSGSDTALSPELHTRTTRTDQVADANQVDIGYHYPVGD